MATALTLGLRAQQPQANNWVEQEVLVQLKPGFTTDVFQPLATALDTAEFQRIGGVRGTYLLRSKSKSTQALLTALTGHPALYYVEPNHTGLRPDSSVSADKIAPTDTYWPNQWDMRLISADAAWPYGQGASNVAIAIIDQGVRVTHEDLAPNIWSSPELLFDIIINGWLEGVYCPVGTNGINVTQFYQNGYNYCSQSDLTADGHGTGAAGVAGAVGNNGKGIAGTSWASKIVPLSVPSLFDNNTMYTASATDALEFAVMINATTNTNIRVINASWGCLYQNSIYLTLYCPVSSTLQNELKRVGGYGILVVASAGNEGPNNNIDSTGNPPVRIPTSYADPTYYMPGILSVAATTLDTSLTTESLAPYSNTGPNSLALAAPGGDASGYAVEMSTSNASDSGSSAYTNYNGTSAAAPHVAGAAAVLAAQCGSYTGMLGLKQTLVNNVDTLSFLSGKVASGGRLNLYKALKSCMLQNYGVSPAGGSGTSQVFRYTFTDATPNFPPPPPPEPAPPVGWQDLSVMKAFIGPSMIYQANVCYFYLQMTGASSGTVSLVNDAGTGNVGYITIPGSGSVNNSQCTLNATGSSVSGSGSTVTLNLATVFNTTHFSGYQIVYMDATDQNSNDSGWQSMGTWAINVSTSPSMTFTPAPAPAGLSQAFSLQVSDSHGYSDVTGIQFLVSPMTVNAGNSCYVKYDAGGNLLYLVSDDNTSSGTGIVPGTSGATLSNSQCSVNVANAMAPSGSNSYTLTVPVTFFPGLEGNNVVFAAAQGALAGNTQWLPVSVWKK